MREVLSPPPPVPPPHVVAPPARVVEARPSEPGPAEVKREEASRPVGVFQPGRQPVAVSAPELWAGVLRAASDNRRLISIIEDFRIERLEGDAAVIVGRGPLVAMAQASTEAITELFARAGGRAMRVEIRADESPEEAGPDAADAAPSVNLAEHPLVKQAMDLFGVRTPIRVLPRKKEES